MEKVQRLPRRCTRRRRPEYTSNRAPRSPEPWGDSLTRALFSLWEAQGMTDVVKVSLRVFAGYFNCTCDKIDLLVRRKASDNSRFVESV